jgi:hypothetical protein
MNDQLLVLMLDAVKSPWGTNVRIRPKDVLILTRFLLTRHRVVNNVASRNELKTRIRITDCSELVLTNKLMIL